MPGQQPRVVDDINISFVILIKWDGLDMFFDDDTFELKGFALRPPREGSDPMEPPEPYCDTYPVEQYIGRKDKNGKEIYEGDKIKRCQGTAIHQVVSQPGGFSFNSLNSGERCNRRFYPADFIDIEMWKIIGNIHDNPELLEK